MATVEQLERIAKLSAALAPLAGKQRGMRIEADDWNALVGAVKGVLEVDRAQEEASSGSLADAYATRVHEHLGTVSIAWLASDLQARVGDAGGTVSLVAALNDVRRQLEASQLEVARLTAAVEDLQRRMDRSSVDDVDRTNRLRTYEDRLTGVEDLKVTVGGVTGIVDELKPRIDDVLKLQGTLTDPQGNPIDIPAIQAQVKDLQVLRESLVGVTGETLRLQDFETQITDLKNQLHQTTGGGIDERFGGLATDLEGKFNRRLDEQNATFDTRFTQETGAIREDTRTQIAQGLDAAQVTLDQTLAARVVDVETRLNATLDTREQTLATNLRTEITATTQTQIDATVPGIVDKRVGDAEIRLGNVVDTRLNDRLTGVILPPIHRAGAADEPSGSSTAPRSSKPPKAGTTKPASAKPSSGAKPSSTAQPSTSTKRSAPGKAAPAKPAAPPKPAASGKSAPSGKRPPSKPAAPNRSGRTRTRRGEPPRER
jgi:hypothetical protein